VQVSPGGRKRATEIVEPVVRTATTQSSGTHGGRDMHTTGIRSCVQAFLEGCWRGAGRSPVVNAERAAERRRNGADAL